MSRRVLVLDQYGQLGGAQRCLLNLLPAFIEAGLTTHLAAPADGPLADSARKLGVTAHSIPCGPYHSRQKGWTDAARFACDFPLQIARIAALVRKHGIALIYVNGPRLLPAAAALGCPLIFHAHSIVEQVSAARLIRWALRRADPHVIAACEFVLHRLQPPDTGRSRVIYNGAAPLKCTRRSRNDAAPLRIGVIGRIAPEKGQLEFVQAARSVLHHHPCEFVVCGDAMFASSDYARLVRQEAAGLPIEFLGWRKDVPGVLSTLDLLVVPSAAVDATPLVILEAFSAGVPVLAFRSGGIPEMIEDGVNGLLCSPDPAALAQVMLDLARCARPPLDELAARAQKTFSERFSVQRYRSEVLQVVQHAM